MSIISKLFIIFSVVLLVYMILPGPGKIEEISALPNSVKSTLDGDTEQVPNVAGYFSSNFRKEAVKFYVNDYQSKTILPIPPLRLNYPPEHAWTVIKKYTDSTYIEELVYPLRGSLYVNGMEPFLENGEPRYEGATKLHLTGSEYLTKVTLRLFPSSVYDRIIVWIGLVISIYLLWNATKKVVYA